MYLTGNQVVVLMRVSNGKDSVVRRDSLGDIPNNRLTCNRLIGKGLLMVTGRGGICLKTTPRGKCLAKSLLKRMSPPLIGPLPLPTHPIGVTATLY